VVTAGAQPGKRPRKNPIPVDLSIAPMQTLMSCHFGIQSIFLVS